MITLSAEAFIAMLGLFLTCVFAAYKLGYDMGKNAKK